jgi:hypothetical protein
MKNAILTTVVLVASLMTLTFSSAIAQKERKEYNTEDPKQYILRNFKTHDVIFLGEPHKVREHLEFLKELLPLLQQNGISILFFEFTAYEDTHLMDSLLNAPSFDRQTGNRLVGSSLWDWNYKEYVDVLEEAWKMNRKTGPEKFRIIGMNNKTFWSNDRNRLWQEKDWSDVIIKEAIAKNKKALVYCGTHHAITQFQQPYTVGGTYQGKASKDRVGHHIYNAIGNKTMTIWLHYIWPDGNYKMRCAPCNGFFDSLYYTASVNKSPFAFDTHKSQLGEISDSLSLYSLGSKSIKLKEIADGYIVLKPIHELSFISPVKDFVDDKNINLVNKQVKHYDGWNPITAEQANDSLMKYYLELKVQFEIRRKGIK